MSNYFNFDKEQKDYNPIQLSKVEIKKHLGKTFCYLLKRDYDRYRGWLFPRYRVISRVTYNTLWFEDDEDSIDFRDLLQIAVKKEE